MKRMIITLKVTNKGKRSGSKVMQHGTSDVWSSLTTQRIYKCWISHGYSRGGSGKPQTP